MQRAGSLLGDSGAVLRRWGVAASIALAAARPGVAAAQEPGEELARRAFEEGAALEKQGDFAGALAKFTESTELKATLGNRYHRAYCLEMTGQLAAALAEYESVADGARAASKQEIIDATSTRLESLRPRVPQLRLTLAAPPAGAEVTLDGAAVAAPLLDGKAFHVDPGEHVVAAHAPHRKDFSKSVTATESTTTAIDIVLPEVAPPPPAPAAAPPPEPASSSSTLPILTTAGAVVLAGAGVGFFLAGGGAQDDLQAACASKATVVCEEDKGGPRTLDALALGSWIGAAGLAALSVVLWTSRPSSSASATATRLVARSSWMGLEGRFE